MPRMTFSSDNKVNQREDFPRLKLEQTGEKARIWCPEAPLAEYVHNLRMPKIDANTGKQAYRTEKDKDGNDKQIPEWDFVSRPLCLGQASILEENGLDPKHCPACRAAQKTADMVDAPVRRFAMHVVRYSTKTDGTPTKPLQASVNVYSFTDFMFNKLVDIAQEFPGGLSAIDLVLTLKTAKFQQYDIMGSPNSLRNDPKVAALLDEVYKENQAKDLAAFCGMSKKKEFVEADILKITTRWDMILGRGGAATTTEAENLSEGLEDLLGSSDSTPAAAPAPAVKQADNEGVDFNSLFD